MRHLRKRKSLGVSPSHGRAMLRNLVTAVLENERIESTVLRTKMMRPVLDRMITLGKKGDLASRRKALAFVKSKKAMEKLFSELPERYAERKGGYSRIIRSANRRGDNAQLAYIILLDGPKDPYSQTSQTV